MIYVNDCIMEKLEKALSILIRKKETGSPEVPFDKYLETNTKFACEVLELKYSDITHDLIPKLNYNKTSSENVRWKFICLSFHILLSLDDKSELYSVSLVTNIKSVLQFIVSFGILPNLIAGVGIDMNVRFKNANKLPEEELSVEDKYYRLSLTTHMLLNCLNQIQLRYHITENHFGDILAALLQLTSAPLRNNNNLDEDFFYMVLKDRDHFNAELKNVLIKAHPPLVTRELMFLHGNKKSPIWLKKTVYKILNERILMKNGVESLVRALFDANTKDVGIDWKYMDVLPRLLMTNPKFNTDEVYFKNICGQLLNLLNKRNYNMKRIENYETAFILCTKYLYQTHKDICETMIIEPLLHVLLQVTEGNSNLKIETFKLEQNIFILHSCFIESSANFKIISIKYLKPIILILYNLFYNLYRSSDAKVITASVSDILLKYMNECDDTEKNVLFEHFLYGKNIEDVPNANPNLKFSISNEEIKTVNIEESNFDPYPRSECVEYLIQLKNWENIAVSFFVYLLEVFTNLYKVTEHNKEIMLRKLLTYKLLSQSFENPLILRNLKTNLPKLLIFAENMLQLLYKNNVHRNEMSCSEDYEFLFLVVMVVHTITKDVENKHILKDFNVLLSIMKKIYVETSNDEIKRLINDILEDSGKEQKIISDYERALDEVCSTLLPIRGHGLQVLVKLIEDKDSETLARKQYVLNIFQQNLKNDDTFIYLRAINGLAALANVFPGTTLDALTDEYLNPRGMTASDAEVRLKTGEILIRVTSSLGDVAPKYKALLLNTFLAGTRDSDSLIRASSFSNLGEVCKILGYKLGTMITDILSCIQDCIQYENQIEVRRAAVTVVRQLFVGLETKMIVFLKDDILPLYRILKSIYLHDPDSVMRLQAQLALEQLNENTKNYLTPEINMFPNVVLK